MAQLSDYYSIIKSPVITEKATSLMPKRQYLFWVDKKANKIEIKKAIEKIYNVKVEKITSMIVEGKKKKLRNNQPGRTPSRKKVFVKLKEGCEIKHN